MSGQTKDIKDVKSLLHGSTTEESFDCNNKKLTNVSVDLNDPKSVVNIEHFNTAPFPVSRIGEGEIAEEKLSPTVKAKINQPGGGGSGWGPDDEDIELVETAPGSGVYVNKFKNRAFIVGGQRGYQRIPSNFDWQNIPAEYANCDWEIRYKHDLGGLDVDLRTSGQNIPNVRLINNGGLLVNGNIYGLNTEISSKNVKLFGDDLTLKNKVLFTNKLTPQLFGAIGDGVTDDTQAFIRMFGYVTLLTSATNDFQGFEIYAPDSISRITQDITIEGLRGCTVNFVGELFFDNCNGFVFKRALDNTFYFMRVIGEKDVLNTELDTLTKNGIEFENCAKNKIYINKIIGFKKGFFLTSFDYEDGQLRGSYQNEINFKEIRQCYDCIRILSKDTGASWINENIFRSGSLDGYNNLVQGTEGETNQSSAYYHNNKFINLAFEQIRGGGAIIFYQARANHVISPRFEGSSLESGYQVIFEGPACAENLYLAHGYNVELTRVSLNLSGIVNGSELYGDLRISTTRVARHVVAADSGDLLYESINDHNIRTQNNTINKMIGEDYLFSFKDKIGNTHKLVYYGQTINYVDDVDLLNGFTNFSSVPTSTYARFNYMLKDENTLEIGGVIKGGAKDSLIFTLPSGFRPDIRYRFPITIQPDTGDLTVGFIEICGSEVRMLSDMTNVNRVYLGRLIIPIKSIQ